MNKHPVVWFYILAFGISWLGWMPTVLGSHGIAPFVSPYFQSLLILAALGPALSAGIVTQAIYGKAQVERLFKSLVQWRVNAGWYVAAVLTPIALLLVAQTATRFFGFSTIQSTQQDDRISLALSAFVMSLFANPWEEVGWRGFALPHLQKRYTALVATLIVGVLWGLWHLPLFCWKGNPMSTYPFWSWFAGTVAGAFVYTWLYNGAKGSLLIVALFHVALNTFGVIIRGVSMTMLSLLNVVIAIGLTIAFGSTNLSHQPRVCANEPSRAEF